MRCWLKQFKEWWEIGRCERNSTSSIDFFRSKSHATLSKDSYSHSSSVQRLVSNNEVIGTHTQRESFLNGLSSLVSQMYQIIRGADIFIHPVLIARVWYLHIVNLCHFYSFGLSDWRGWCCGSFFVHWIWLQVSVVSWWIWLMKISTKTGGKYRRFVCLWASADGWGVCSV